MGIPVTAILKGIDLVLAGLQVADKGITKIKRWNRDRKWRKARNARLVKEIKKP